MLKLFYDAGTDYLEIFFKRVPNYGDDLSRDVIIFKSEKDESVVGYGIYRPQKKLLAINEIDPKTKIAALCFVARKKSGYTEKEWAQELNISYRTYQRIEEGEISKIDDFLRIQTFLKGFDLSRVFRATP